MFVNYGFATEKKAKRTYKSRLLMIFKGSLYYYNAIDWLYFAYLSFSKDFVFSFFANSKDFFFGMYKMFSILRFIKTFWYGANTKLKPRNWFYNLRFLGMRNNWHCGLRRRARVNVLCFSRSELLRGEK